MRFFPILCLISMLPFAGCAASTDSAESASEYAEYSCDRLNAEIKKLGAREDSLKELLGHVGRSDGKFTFRHRQTYDNNPNEAEELTRVHARMQGLQTELTNRGCEQTHYRRDPFDYGPYEQGDKSYRTSGRLYR